MEKSTKCGWWQGHLGTWPDIKEFAINLWSIDKSDFNCKIYQADFSRSLLLELQNYRFSFCNKLIFATFKFSMQGAREFGKTTYKAI